MDNELQSSIINQSTDQLNTSKIIKYDKSSLINQILLNNYELKVLTIIRPITDYNNNFNEMEGLRLSELLSAANALNIPTGKLVFNTIGSYERLEAIVRNWELLTHKLIQLSKLLTQFNDICSDDQIALIKYGCIEMCCLRQTVAYDLVNRYLKINYVSFSL